MVCPHTQSTLVPPRDVMTADKTISAKITRPTLSGPVQRERLFTLLDGRKNKPITWVSAPGGSGKSTLVASYLDARKLPCIWYQCDEGDADLATFFYYMGLAAKKAAPRFRKPLPLLTSEYLAGIPVFTRRYFEQLYSRVTTIVLDNYQDVPVDSPFHGMIATGFDAIREGVRILVISRSEPPTALARLQANDKIELLSNSDIRFTLEESRDLVHGRIPLLDDNNIQLMHEKTKGWAAGIILMLERASLDGTMSGTAPDRVFDYFAGEIFNKLEQVVQEFLLKTSFLPLLNVPLAEKLTGVGTAQSILSALNRHHYFTERLSGRGQDYQYHPLFRDFLQSWAKSTFAPDQLTALQKKAAQLLEQAGQIEDAARLYCEAGSREGLSRIVKLHARELLMQGRRKTVEEWLACISGGVEKEPWLLYWSGMCAFPFDIARSREYLEKAFAAFKKCNEPSGIYLSWVGVVDTYGFALDEWQRLDDWIALFGSLSETYASIPTREIDLVVSSRMLMALTLRKIDQPQMVQTWLERVSALLQENPSFAIQMDMVFFMSVYHLWKGEYQKNAIMFDKVEVEIQQCRLSPFADIRIKLMRGIHYWVTAEYDLALKTLSEGLLISEQSGVHIYDSMLWSFMAAAEMAPGNTERAVQSLKNQMASLRGMAKTLDIYFYHIHSAWCAILSGNPSCAIENLEMIAAKVDSMGVPYYRALWNIGMAQAHFLQHSPKDAMTHVQTAHRISLDMKSPVMEWYSLLIGAYFLLLENNDEQGLTSLRSGLMLGRSHGYVHLQFYQPAVMCYLFARALSEGIERDYVTGLIRKLGLTPPVSGKSATSECYLEEWPYPVKIYTLGRFEILRDDEPLHFSGKEQKKPLELLKALIAFGGRDVPEERLTDSLWPDADGDQARKSFETTLGRLRRLLGGEDVITCRARQLTINPLHCWVDTLVMVSLFDKIPQAPNEQILPLCEKTVALYKGPFLPGDIGLQWAVTCRETLKNRLLRAIGTAGRHYEQAGEWEKGADCFSKGVETDTLAEEFYRRLMSCQRNLGNYADAVKTYNRCRSLLQAELGIQPSPETTAVYTSIIQKQKP